MSAVPFDTLDFTHRLREAGFDEKQAEVVVRVLADAQNQLVTREYLDTKLESMEARLIGENNKIYGEIKLNRVLLLLVVAAVVASLLKVLFS